MAGRIKSIESLRFILFLGIFLFHSVSSWFSIGWGGVQSFLVISSFFLTGKLIDLSNEKIRPLELLKRRIKRIYPAYLLLVIAFTLIFVLYKKEFPNDFIWYLFSAQNFFWSFTGCSSAISTFTAHTWYITLDMYLFIIWILLFKFFAREHYKKLCIVAILFAVCYRTISILFFDNIFLTYTMPWSMLDTFGLGGLLALAVKEDSVNKSCLPEIIIGSVGIIGCILISAVSNHLSVLESYQSFRSASGYANSIVLVNVFLFFSILTIGLLKYCLYNKHTLLENPILVKLGGLSYILYMFHWPILQCIKHFTDNPALIITSGLILSIFVAWMWDKLVEPQIRKLLY